jgi:uncharacterized membrane protein YadS
MTIISRTKLAGSLTEGADARVPSTIHRRSGRNSREILPGPFLNWVIAGVAFAIRQMPGMATFSPIILSTVIEIAFHHIVRAAAWAKQGVTFSLRWLPGIAASAVTATNTDDEDVAYACVTIFGSVAILAYPIPTDAKAWIVAATTFLSIALAATGLETNIGKLTAKGFRPALLGALAFPFIADLGLTLIKLME